jgi:hypothetical protein
VNRGSLSADDRLRTVCFVARVAESDRGSWLTGRCARAAWWTRTSRWRTLATALVINTSSVVTTSIALRALARKSPAFTGGRRPEGIFKTLSVSLVGVAPPV